MSTTLCFIDCETTGLDPRIHQPYEVCVWRETDAEPVTYDLPHTLEFADPTALQIGGYHDRHFAPDTKDDGFARRQLVRRLRGVTLVGCNPAFDAAMMRRFIGAEIWHYRHINIADGAMWLFGWNRPKGLADIVLELSSRGHDIPEPDHTAQADVLATRAAYYALRKEAGHGSE